MNPDRSRKLVRRLSGPELDRLAECLDHALTKPSYDLTRLVPILIRGHHHIPPAAADRMIAAIRDLQEDELLWLCDHIREISLR